MSEVAPMTKSAKLDHLVSELTLGECALSELLREMKLLGDDKVVIEFLQSLRQSHPESTKAILACGSRRVETCLPEKVIR